MRVTVVGTTRRLDADLPDSAPVVELLADVVGLLGENANGAAVEWGLLKVGGMRLDSELSLADQGVVAGSMLFLRDVSTAPPAPAIEDFAGQVAVIVDAQKGRWQASMTPGVLAWVAAGAMALAGLAVLAVPDAGGRAAAGLAGVVIAVAAGLALVRLRARAGLATVVTFGSLPAWAAAAAGIAGLAGATTPMELALGLAGVGIGSVVATAIAGDDSFYLMSGLAEATLVPAVVLAVTTLLGGSIVDAAAVLAVVELALLAMLPVTSAWLLRAAPVETISITSRLNRGRRSTNAARIAEATVIVAACAVLAAGGGWWARGLVVATAVATAVRARHYRFAGDVIPLLAAGIASLLLLELPLAVWLAVGARGTAGLAILLLADASVLVAAGLIVRRWSFGPRLTRWLRPLELLAVAASVPLALGVLGTYDAVVHYARGLG